MCDHDGDVHVRSEALGHAETCEWQGVHLRTYPMSNRAAYVSVRMFKDLKRLAPGFNVFRTHCSSTLISFVAALAAGRAPLVISPYFHQQSSNSLLSVLKFQFERMVDRPP